ncbi:MAG: SDR family NAD(P)-dependent oxidoreductase [Anaerolineales bacterium]|nr:SDR family NAD(P)-dependent oxidoreductase [Anaerolineales bacterium]
MPDLNKNPNRPAPATPLNPRRRAIIVGASGGIGAALSRKLAREGFTLALIDRSQTTLQSLCDEINQTAKETRALAYEHDATQYNAVPDALRRVVADLGGVDALVYVAGVIYFPALDEFNFAQDQKMVEVNLLGAMAWMGAIAPLFQNAKSGQIVGVSSVAGDRGRIGNPGYNASKAGMTNYLEGLRNRLTRHGVNVLTVKPGMVKTDMLKLPGAPKPVLALEADQVADLIWDGMKKRKQTIYVAGIWKLVMLVIRHIPSFIFRRLNF